MSESSLENSGVDTLGSMRSALSLGQCIKLNAQESNEEVWHELQPSFDKNWHTLQGVVTSEITMDEDLNEASFDYGQSRSKSDCVGNAIPPLLLHENSKTNTSSGLLETTKLPKLLSTDVGVSKPKNNTNLFQPTMMSNNQEDVASAMINILQNDDSLAQRVRDLLEEDSSEKISHVDVVANKDSAGLNQQLTQSVLEDYKHEDEQIDDGLKIMAESNYEPSTGRASLNTDIFPSLNASTGTEYGELPETVDIPKDIVKHLENMRLLSNEAKAKQAWKDTEKDEVNIKGGVGFHLGSNPTTPQFPVEEEKLNQLQTYIEKKTGLPVISPLVLGEMFNSELQAKTPSLLGTTNNELTVETFQRNSSQVTPNQNNEGLSSNAEEGYQNQTQLEEHSDNYACIERIEPEGMSPSIDHAATSTPDTQQKEQLQKEISASSALLNVPLNRSTHAIDDDALLVRIRSAWSDPKNQFSANSSLVRQPDQSFAESNDSLALHVKALLEEELNSSMQNGDIPHQTSNLSEVIESFENTELWKYVRQFLPAENRSFNNSLPGNESSLNQSSLWENDNSLSEINNSLLEKIREEFRKENELKKENISCTTDEGTPIKSTGLVEDSNSKRQSTPQQNVGFENVRSVDEEAASSLLKPRFSDPKQSVTPLSEPQQNSRSFSNTPYYSDEPVSLPKASLTKLEKMKMDTIPGIPDFCRSVITPTPTSDSKRQRGLEVRRDYQTNSTKVSSRMSENFSRSPTLVPVALDEQENDENKNENDIRVSSFHTEASEYYITSELEESVNHDQPYSSNRDLSPLTPVRDIGRPLYGTRSLSKSANSPEKSRESHNQTSKKDFRSYRHLHQMPAYQPRSSYFGNINADRPHLSRSGPKDDSKNIKHSDFGYQALPKAQRNSGTFVPSVSAGSGKNSASPKPKSSTIRPLTRTDQARYQIYSKGQSSDRLTPKKLTSSPQQDKSIVNLPTFEELIKQQENEKITKNKHPSSSNLGKSSRNSVDGIDLIPTSDKSPNPSEKNLNLTFTENKNDSTVPMVEDKSKQWMCEENCSIRPQVPSKSYQETTLPSALSYNQLSGSDLDTHRRTISTQSSDVDCRSNISMRSIPQTLSEFEHLDKNSQKKVVKQILEWAKNRKNTSSKHSLEPEKESKFLDVADLQRRSYSSNQAIYDSDSTEYCDLPSSKSTSTQNEEKSVCSILGVDESKAEKIMKRLLNKIEKQKQNSSVKKDKVHQKRLKASTPQHVGKAPINKESTDSDGSLVQVIQIPHKQHAAKKKKRIAIINEDSESSDPIVLQVKRNKGRIIVLDRSMQTNEKKRRKPLRNVSTNFPSPIRERKKTVAIQTTINQTENSIKNNNNTCCLDQKVIQDTENIDDERSQRISSFFVKVPKQHRHKNTKKASISKPIKSSVAWYEPYKYEPAWKKQEIEKVSPINEITNGLVQVTLQEALHNCFPDFVSKSRERQRRIKINSEERKMQAIWAEERGRVFGVSPNMKQNTRSGPAPVIPRQRPEISRKQMVAEAREKYNQLPEVVRKKYEEARKKDYTSNRLKAQLYQKKIQRQILGRGFNNFS